MAPLRLTETRVGMAASTVSGSGGLSTAATNAAIKYTYNNPGEVASETQATGDYTDYYYDSLGRLALTRTTPFTDYTGTSVQTSTYDFYDGLNDLTLTAVGAGSTWRTTANAYGAGGRLSATTDAAGNYAAFSYDGDGDGRLIATNTATVTSSGTAATAQ